LSSVKTRAYLNRERGIIALFSTIEHKNIDKALSEDSWVTTMEEELINSLRTSSGILFPLLRINQ